MALPAAKAPSTGTHVLFLVRNPNGISSVISYLSSRSIKSWTATSLNDAIPKIKNHGVQMVFLSIGLKNSSVPAVIENIKTQFGLPIVIFSEEISRKIEGDLAKLSTANKIVPPNQNAKFLQMVQKNIESGGGDGQAKKGANVEELLPPNAEPVDAHLVPHQGRWLKINVDDNAVAPFTYKLIQPRHAIIGRTRFFYMGPRPPEATPDSKGWTAPEGTFYVSGRVVESAREEEVIEEGIPVKLRTFQISDSEAGPLRTLSLKREHGEENAAEPFTQGEDESGSAAEKDPQARAGALEQFSRRHVEPVAAKAPRVAVAQRLGEISQNFKRGIKDFSDKIAAYSKWSPRMQRLAKFFEDIPEAAEVVDRVLGRPQPSMTREPGNIMEQKMLKASFSAVTRPLKDVPLDGDRMVEKIGVAFLRSGGIKGFVVSDLNDFSDQNFATFEKLIDVMKLRFDRASLPFEVLLPPSIVCIEPLSLVAAAMANSHFLLHAENSSDRLVVAFVEAPAATVPVQTEGHDKLIIPPEALDPNQKLLFNIYLNLPANEKQLQYFRIGHLVPGGTVSRLVESPTAEVLIDPTAAANYYGYMAVTAIKKKR